MKKKDFQYDYKFDWILKKQLIAPEVQEDYKKKILEKIDGKNEHKHKQRAKDDEEDN